MIAERYDRFAGDVTFEHSVTTGGSLGPHLVLYPDGLALVRLPTVWQAVRLDTGAVVRSVPTVDGTGFTLTFDGGGFQPASIPVQITARVG